MAKAELKTRPTEASVDEFLSSIADDQQRADSRRIVELMMELSGERPVMWGPAIVGFGSVPLKYASGRELDWPRIGFSPRKQNLTLYVLGSGEHHPEHKELLAKLGKHSRGKSCLYIKRLADVDETALRELIWFALESTSGGNGTC